MAKKKPIDTSAPIALKHNPFAALAPGVGAPVDGPTDPVAQNDEPRIDPANLVAVSGKIVVRREKKGRGGKTVTRVTGVPAPRADELLARLKKALGCGAVIEGEDLVLLGSLVDRAADWLEAEGARRVVRAG